MNPLAVVIVSWLAGAVPFSNLMARRTRGIDLRKVIEIQEMAERCGFKLADMRAFDAAITPEKIAATREAARARRESAVA